MKWIALWSMMAAAAGCLTYGHWGEFRNRPRYYYVVYQYGAPTFEAEQGWGLGCVKCSYTTQIRSMVDIDTIKQDAVAPIVEKESGLKDRSIVILSWKEIEK